jgi:hypothetical protein
MQITAATAPQKIGILNIYGIASVNPPIKEVVAHPKTLPSSSIRDNVK